MKKIPVWHLRVLRRFVVLIIFGVFFLGGGRGWKKGGFWLERHNTQKKVKVVCSKV